MRLAASPLVSRRGGAFAPPRLGKTPILVMGDLREARGARGFEKRCGDDSEHGPSFPVAS